MWSVSMYGVAWNVVAHRYNPHLAWITKVSALVHGVV